MTGPVAAAVIPNKQAIMSSMATTTATTTKLKRKRIPTYRQTIQLLVVIQSQEQLNVLCERFHPAWDTTEVAPQLCKQINSCFDTVGYNNRLGDIRECFAHVAHQLREVVCNR